MEVTQRIKARLKEVQDWNSVIDEIEAEAGALASGPEQSLALYDLARACEDMLLDKARAMSCYQKAFKLDQTNLIALERAREIYREMASLEMVTKLMGLELRANQDASRAAGLNYAYGTAKLNQRDIDAAKGFLAAAAESGDPIHQARFQETLYDRNNWEFALDNIFGQLKALIGADDPLGAEVANLGAQIAGLFMRAARILQQEAPEDPRLLPTLFKALDANPQDAEAGFVAELLLQQGGHLQHIQALQDRRASLIEDIGQRITALAEFGTIWQVRLQNPEMAAYFYRQALELAYEYGAGDNFPWHIAAFRAVRTVGPDADLIVLGDKGLANLSDPNDASLLALQAGELAWQLEDIESARRLLAFASERAPTNPVVLSFEANVGPLESAVEEPAVEEPAVEEPAVEEPVAEEPVVEEPVVEEPAVEEPVAEEPAIEEPVAQEPEAAVEEPAVEEPAVEEPAVEEPVAEEPVAEAPVVEEPVAEEPAVEEPVAEEPAVEEPVAEEPAIEEPVAQEPVAAKPEASGATMSLGDESYTEEEMAMIAAAEAAAKKGGKWAIDAWRDVVNKLPPDKVYPREQLKAVYVESGKWSNVADLYKDLLKRIDDETAKIPLTWELVRIYRDQLKQPGLVVTTLASLEKAVEATGDNAALLEVVEAQQEQFDQMKRWPDLISRIRRRAELHEDPIKKVELHLEAGNLFLDKFNNQAEAIKSFESALEIDEYNPEALAKLKDLYGRRRDWEKMIVVQQRELKLIADPVERQTQLLDVARTAGSKIKKPSIAIELWSAVLEGDPTNLEALEVLEGMQEREKDWAALAKTLQTLTEVISDATKRSAYLVKLGLLYSDKLDDNQAAIRTWEALHELEPDNRRAQDALKKLYLSEGNMDALEGFYAKQDKWAEFIRVLEREAETAEQEDRRIDLTLKVAQLYKVRLEKADRATRTLEKALEQAPTNLTLAEALLELYEEANDERHVSKPLQVKLDHTEDPESRQSLLARLADLAERVQSDPAQAFVYWRRSLDEDYTQGNSAENMRRLAEQTNTWGDLVESFEAAYGKYGAQPDSLPLRLAVAEVYEKRIADLERALAVNQEILEIDAEQEQALASLENLYLALGREEDLLKVLATKLELASDDDDRRQIQARIGSIHEQLGHPEQAVTAYNAVLDMGVEDASALAALDRLYLGLENWSALADILRRELAVVEEQGEESEAGMKLPDRATIRHRLGSVYQDHLGNAEDAIELFREVLEYDPDHADARQRLESWLEHEDFKVRTATILRDVYQRREEWPQLVRALEILAAAEDVTPDRVVLLLKIGEIQAQAIGDSRAAFDAFARAFREDAEDETAQQALENIAGIDERWQDFAELYEGAVAKDLPSELMKALLHKLAGVYDSQLALPEKAIACYQRAVDIDPENASALDALEQLFQRAENWGELLDVYRRKVEFEDDPDLRQGLRFKIAYLQEEMLQQNPEAIATYNEILADDDTNTKAIVALDRLYQAQGNWSDLAEILDRQLALAGDPDDMIQLSLRLGDVRLQKLAQAGLAVEIYRRVFDYDPQNEHALAALETLLTNDEQQLVVAKILEPIYRQTNEWSKLIQAYEIMVARSLDPSERISLLHMIGELYEIAGEQPEQAFEAIGRALRADPANEETQRRLDSLANQMGAFTQLVELYESAIADIVDDQLSIQILDKVAKIYETTLDDAVKAAGSYEKILGIDPGNFAAIDALIEVHRRTNNFEELVAAVTRKAEMVEDADDRKALLLYAANVRETLMENPEAAIELYQQVLGIDDADTRALDALEKLYLGLENWEALRDVYQRKTELADTPEDRRQALHVLGQVHDRELGDVERAIDTYQAILDIDPTDYDAIQALDRLYGQAERWHDQLQILERAVEVADRAEAQTELRHRIGTLWENQLADPVRAVEAYREVLAHDPGHEPTIAALGGIAHGEIQPMLAAEVLEPFYEQLAEWEKLIDLYEVMAAHTEDPIARMERLHKIAEIYERQLQEFDKGFDIYARALTIDPDDENTIEQMARLAGVTGDYEKYARILDEQARAVSDPLVKAKILKRVAAVRLNQLSDVETAIARYQSVLNEDPEDADAIEALDTIFTHLERWGELVANLERQIRIADDEAASIALQYRMGQIYQISMNDLPHAIEAYKEILNIQPDHGPSQQALEFIFYEGEHQHEIAEILEPIYFAAERWEPLVKLGEARLESIAEAADRFTVIQNVAEICEKRLGDISQAYLYWLRAYIDDPTNIQITDEIERLADATQEWAAIVDVGDQILDASEAISPDVRQAVLARSARVLDNELREYERAIGYYRRVLELDSDNVEALAALDRIYSHAGMYVELAEILQRRIAVEMEPELLVQLELRLAHTFEAYLGNIEQAIGAYTRVLDNEPGNAAALERLEALYMSQHRWQELFDTYQKMVDVAHTDEDMAGCYQRMAKIAAEALDRETDAVDLWSKVLDLRGEDGLALSELANLHERAQRWEELVEVLERLVYVVEDPQERVDAYQRLGRTYGEKLERDRQALDAWINALDIDATNLETLETLKRLYEESQAWVELIDILQRMVQLPYGTMSGERLRDLWAQIGGIQGEYLMATDEAIAAWLQVLALAAGDMQALAALEELYTTEGRWNDAIKVLERKVEVVEDDESKIDVLMQVASIWEEKLDNKDQAAGAYLEILELRAGHPPACDALEAIYRETEQWEQLSEQLINRAEVTGEDQLEDKVNYLQQGAKVFEEKLGDLDSAFAVLQAAFNVDYSNEDTSRELERIATIANKWGELLNEYNSIVNEIEDKLERCELWVKIGRWYGEHLDRPDYGIQSLHKALELNPESVNALRELANFYRRAGEAAKLVETLIRIVPLEQEPEVQAATLLDLAQVQETGLGDLPASVESYRRVLEIDGESIVALDSLARLHETQAQWVELVGVLERRVAIMSDPDEVLVIKKRIGAVQEYSLQDLPAAIETFKDITASEPTDRDALGALERLYMAQGNITEYLETLEAELDATADVAEQIAIYEKMALALVSHANDRERACEVLEKILTLDPNRDETYQQLEQLYFGLERWSELVDTYRNHVDASPDYGTKIALYQAMGEVYEKQIQDIDRAIDCYREILNLDPNHFQAADTLSRLQEAIEDWHSAVETMDRLVQLNQDANARLELLTRMGRIHFQKLEDWESAERRLADALALDPGHVPALIVLAELYKARLDWLKAARTLQTASECSTNSFERTNLAAEAGFIYLEELEDKNNATAMFATAITLDPEHVKVGKVLSRIYYEAEKFELADPIFDMLARKSDQLELDDEDMRELYLRAARVARKLGNGEKALKRYKSAYDIDSTNHEVLTGMADLLFQQENWERSFKLYQTILVQHRDSQSDDDTVLVYFRLGTIKRRQNEPRKALNYMEKALEVQPYNREVLEAVIDLQSSANDWEGVIQAKRALVDVVDNDDERFNLHKEIGDLYTEKLDNKVKASDAYNQALDLRPNDYPMLHTLLALFQEIKKWDQLISIIDRIVEIEKDPIRRSRYNYTAAVVLRDNLNAQDEAIDRFNTVLDDDPKYLKGFQAIDALVTKNKDWKSLERSYRKMIKRLPATGEEELALALWSNLGEIYRTRLNDLKAAAEVYSVVATQFDPNNPKWQIVLAELYERLLDENPTEYAPRAVAAHQSLIAQEPYRIESYHALYNIYKSSNQVDKAWCVSQALAFLKKASDEQTELYNKHKPEGFVRARQRLSEVAMRKSVFHPDQDAYLTAILGLVAQPLAAWRAKELPPTIKGDSRIDITLDPQPFAQIAKYIKDVLNVSAPDVYLRPNEPGDIAVLNVKRDGQVAPTMVVYQNLLRGKKEHHVAFALGKSMMELYPPHYAYVTIDRSPQSLKQVFMACMRICGMPVQGDTAALDSIAREIQGRMSAGMIDQLRSLMKKFIQAGGSTDVKRWAAAVELTGYRVGFLLCGDLPTSALMISQESSLLGSTMTPKDKIKELVLYSISEDYFDARRSIGVQVG